MEGNCFIEVDVNGEEVFVVDKRVISAYSGRVRKLLCKLRDATGNLKVIFHEFPGGVEGFELIARFCYNKGKAGINASNIFPLTSAAEYMEMNRLVDGGENLCQQIETSLEEIKYWRWSEVVVALKQCENQRVGGVSLDVLDKLVSSLIERIVSCSETSPTPSASSSNRSCDTRSSESLKSSSARAMWWFDELVVLDAHVIEMVVRLMVCRNIDSGLISRFLFHYQKSRSASASCSERGRLVEAVIEMLGILDVRCVSCKSFFELLRVAVKLRVSRQSRNKVESAIGSLLDQAMLDDLLIPSSPSRCYLYNVNLVLSFLKSFLGKGVGSVESSRVAHVAKLIDSYLAEIAPDPCLKPSKFLAVIMGLPDSARDSFNGVYHAVNLYLEVHPGLSEEERRILCSSIKYEKLSVPVLSHLSENARFPSEHVALAIVFQRSKCEEVSAVEGGRSNCKDEVLVCMKMQPQIVKMRKSKISRLVYGRSLPLLCS
ncbi:BTB/POZ domain-containing protein-like protein isoform X1 [Salvia divinorum]|uniref:BTB/POZ domain-containing protein-like protein isoform X1 n=1 Tax=Salvia divinorum TaxID=28513 RepID=A0ABD1I0Z5_SALDI